MFSGSSSSEENEEETHDSQDVGVDPGTSASETRGGDSLLLGEERSPKAAFGRSAEQEAKEAVVDSGEVGAVHGLNAFLGSAHDPLHPSNLNADLLQSNSLWKTIVNASASDESALKSSAPAAATTTTGSVGKSLQDPKASGADRRLKGCPPEVEQQFRELLDAGLISRADFLSAIEKYIENLPDDLKPVPGEEGGASSKEGGGGASSSSSDVSLDADDTTMTESDDNNVDSDDESGDDDTLNVAVPTGYVHTPITSGDATNYPVDGDSCCIHFEGRIIRRQPGASNAVAVGQADDDVEEEIVFDSTYLRKQPVTVQIGRGDIIMGIEYALRFMTPGQKSKLVIPSEWGYGAVGYPPLIRPGQTLFYDVELIRFSNDADARVTSGRPANPVPIGMEQFTHGEFDMDNVTMKVESSYAQAINDNMAT